MMLLGRTSTRQVSPAKASTGKASGVFKFFQMKLERADYRLGPGALSEALSAQSFDP